MRFLIAIALTLSFAVAGAGTAVQPASSFERFPECTSEKVHRKLVRRFNQTEKIYWRDRGFTLSEIRNPHHHTTNPFPASGINRHFCHGDAVFSDGTSKRVHFLIEEGAGFAGFTWNVEYCIHGLDPWRYYDGYCRVLSR